MSALYPSNVSTRVTSHRIPSYRTTCAGVTSSGQLIVNSTSSCAFTAFAANIAVGDWISARPCSLPFQKAKNDGEGEGVLSPPLLPFNIGIGPRPNVLTAAQAKTAANDTTSAAVWCGKQDLNSMSRTIYATYCAPKYFYAQYAVFSFNSVPSNTAPLRVIKGKLKNGNYWQTVSESEEIISLAEIR